MKRQIIEWHDVTKELPEICTVVLARLDNGEVLSLWQNWEERRDDEDWLTYEDFDDVLRQVVEWAYIPGPDENLINVGIDSRKEIVND